MCGIVGMWSARGLGDKAAIERRLGDMVAMIQHRGPDGTGVWTDGTVGMGHARLSVIDLSASASQPMSDRAGDIHITFNGEIYNFRALRDQLSGYGHQFRTQSDTEVIIEGYRRWGDDVIDHLRGMFAFALWDQPRGRLLLARDRLGKKPLYYAWNEGTLYFASEIKGILAGSGMARQPDLQAIDHYLTYQYVPAPFTAFQGIRKLRPAHRMVVSGAEDAKIEPYWSLDRPDQVQPRPVQDLQEEIVARFDEAVRLRLVSDVPVGAFLSGGIDSASIVASMARAGRGTVKTFTIGFDEPAYDERAPARLVAERYGTEHHEEVVRPDVISILSKLVWHYGEPFADSSALPTYCVSELTRAHVKVALNGDGGDEAFLGYPRYAGARLGAWLDVIPLPVREILGRVGRGLPFETSTARPLRYLKRFLSEADVSDARRYAKWIQFFADTDKQNLYGDAMPSRADGSSLDLIEPWFAGTAPAAARAAYTDINSYLPDDLLVKVDVATMAHGLEGRSPFLDHEFLAFAASIPASLKMKGLRTKSLLKSAMASRLPRELLSRPKMGFGIPLDRWLREELRDMIYDVLMSETARCRGLFRPDAVRAILDDHMAKRRNHQYRIWALLFLELWFREWIDPPAIAVPALSSARAP